MTGTLLSIVDANPKVSFTGQATQNKVTLDDIERVRNDMVEFSKYFESTFYQRKWNL